ncbi:hypothetical protein AAG570_005020 [Ranatra chinensis]|uniref:Uncharacterized protein n=1 Tax=Ranatra chinensis TaxID=642074 RepID=A0ABD0YE69_9HEMI
MPATHAGRQLGKKGRRRHHPRSGHFKSGSNPGHAAPTTGKENFATPDLGEYSTRHRSQLEGQTPARARQDGGHATQRTVFRQTRASEQNNHSPGECTCASTTPPSDGTTPTVPPTTQSDNYSTSCLQTDATTAQSEAGSTGTHTEVTSPGEPPTECPIKYCTLASACEEQAKRTPIITIETVTSQALQHPKITEANLNGEQTSQQPQRQTGGAVEASTETQTDVQTASRGTTTRDSSSTALSTVTGTGGATTSAVTTTNRAHSTTSSNPLLQPTTPSVLSNRLNQTAMCIVCPRRKQTHYIQNSFKQGYWALGYKHIRTSRALILLTIKL